MEIPHICGPDEILQRDSRRPATYHVQDVLEWAFDPTVEPIVTVVRWACAAVSFVVGFALGPGEASWSSTQATWGVHKVISRTTAWSATSAGTAVTAIGSILAGSLGESTFAGAATGVEWVSREVHRLNGDRMGKLYPQVVAEWSVEVFRNLGACFRALLMLRVSGSSTDCEAEIE